MKALDLYWKSNREWIELDSKEEQFVLKEDAPEEAKKSYENYLRQIQITSRAI